MEKSFTSCVSLLLLDYGEDARVLLIGVTYISSTFTLE